MNAADRISARLDGLPGADADRFLAEAIAFASVAEVEALTAAAMARSAARALAAAVLRLADLPPARMDALAVAPGALTPVLIDAAAAADRAVWGPVLWTRLCMLLARRSEPASLVPLAALLAPDRGGRRRPDHVPADAPPPEGQRARSDRGGASSAVPRPGAAGTLSPRGPDPGGPDPVVVGRALLGVVARLVGPDGRRAVPAAVRREIDRALLIVADGWRDHRAPAALVAVAIGADRAGPAVRERVLQGDGPVVHALRGVAASVGDPICEQNLLRWLGDGPRGSSAARWLATHAAAGRTGPILAAAHLYRSPTRRARLRSVDRGFAAGRALVATAAARPLRARLCLPDLVSGLLLSPGGRAALLDRLDGDPAPVVRFRAAEVRSAVLRQQAGTPRPEDPAWLIRARMHLGTPGALGPSRRAATLAIAPHSGPMDRRLLADAAPRLLRSGDPDVLVDALTRLRRARIVEPVAGEVAALVESASPWVAASAISALGSLPAPPARPLALALRHENPRVRANALDAMAGRRTLARILRPYLDERHNRVRAAAIRALLRLGSPEARPALDEMLEDSHPLHRVSAIWAARAGRALPVLSRLDAMAAGDPLTAVRDRAAMAARYLRASARSRPRAGAVPSEPRPMPAGMLEHATGPSGGEAVRCVRA
ncbi:MAG: HEAT repeat domain-containing protein [Phycisphaeraceae bacterium]|nr:HEAT repeat domain-containing protein [Phycisphaeraceae bacterium]